MDSSLTSKNVPKALSSTLDLKNNKYVIKSGLLYNYFDIKVAAAAEDAIIIRFEKTPPVIMEGIAIVNKKFYKVTPQDLLRGVIRKSREIIYKREKDNGSAGTSTSSNTLGSTDAATSNNSEFADLSNALFDKNESGVSAEIGMDELERANLAWQEQIGPLFDYINEEEGF